MVKLTIAKVGQEKTVETKFGTKKKQGVIFKEFPDIWHDVWASGLKEGQELEGERVSREWEGKTYWNFNLPKKNDVVLGEVNAIALKVGQMNLKLDRILDLLSPKLKESEMRNSDGSPVPFPNDEFNAF